MIVCTQTNVKGWDAGIGRPTTPWKNVILLAHMFTITCDKCGTPHTMDESRIPPSGMVMKCPACSGAMTVMPSRIGEELSLDEFAPAPSMSGHAATTDLGLGGPQRGPAGRGLATGPALAAFDAAQDDGLDLLAPKGPSVSSDIVDLPAPKAPASDIVDLPAPKAPAGARGAGLLDEPDLLAPVGPSATRSDAPDLLAPVGPSPTRGGMPDL
ncbi:MAG: zinc-ribbon domain-containing protein, partial [Armatimonadota bacterium]|nr:zinc-ribbon domain-containing protein [Armatimonadota bacterium]